MSRRERGHLATLLMVAFLVRIVYNVWSVGVSDRPADDAQAYHEIAVTLLQTGTYTYLSRPPLLPTVIAGLYALFGINPFIVRVFLSIVGALTCWIIFLIGREAFGTRVGWYAAWASAVYTMLFRWTGYLLTETLFTLWLCLAILFLLKSGRTPRMTSWLVGGVCLGLATLTRPTTLPFFPFIFVWAWITFAGHRTRPLIASLIVAGAMLVVLTPWTVRNYRVTGAFVPVTTMGGQVLLGANNPKVLDYFKGGWIPPARTGLITPEEIDGLPTVELDRLYQRRALAFIYQNPLFVMKLCVYKFKLFWHLNRAVDPASLQYLVVAGLAAVGAFTARTHWRRLTLLYLVPVFFTGSALIFWGDDRIRSPIEPILLVFAASGAESIRTILKT